MLSGCAVHPDTLCQMARPSWHLNDTPSTIRSQRIAAGVWDSKCTLFGMWK